MDERSPQNSVGVYKSLAAVCGHSLFKLPSRNIVDIFVVEHFILQMVDNRAWTVLPGAMLACYSGKLPVSFLRGVELSKKLAAEADSG